jgi:pyruvate/2-oxoglutarate dehydrogenase complex dihydrolipoamide dehydrogenase (E3) component
METEYDVVIIGAGAVAENVAERVVAGGLTAVLIESELVGGECSYWACMPSKALLRGSAALRAAGAVDGAQQAVSGSVDIARTLARRDAFTHDWDDQSQVDWVHKAGIALVRGHGRISGKLTVDVDVTVDAATAPASATATATATATASTIALTARHAVVVATGSEPLIPSIPGLADAAPWTPREATSATTIPESLIILGGGVVGVEMATAYAGLGCAVTMIVRGNLLGNAEDFAGEFVTTGLTELGVSVRTGVSVESVRRVDAITTAVLSDGTAVSATELLVATGRAPRSSTIGLETIGLVPGEWLTVDDSLLVDGAVNHDIPWLYAVGDINNRALLTHQGKYQARAAGDVITARAHRAPTFTAAWETHSATADVFAVPQVTFSDPEVASVGFTSQGAVEAGYDIRVVDYNLGWVAGASLHADGYRGKARMVVDEKRQVVIGTTFVGADVAELLHAATIAIVGEVPISRLWHAVPAYPTMSEVWLRLLEAYGRPNDE